MPKIKSFADLLKVLAGLFITSLAIQGFISIPGRKGIITMVVPSMADTLYSIFGNAMIIIAYVVFFGLILMVPVAIWNYFRNRRKPEEPSREQIMLNQLVSEISQLRESLQKNSHVTQESNQREDNAIDQNSGES